MWQFGAQWNMLFGVKMKGCGAGELSVGAINL